MQTDDEIDAFEAAGSPESNEGDVAIEPTVPLPPEFKLFEQRHVIDLSSRTRSSYPRNPSMTKEQHVEVAARELRSMQEVQNPLSRAALLALVCGASPEIAALASKLSEKVVRKAMVALLAGREPGVVGRPRSLSTVTDIRFKQWLREKIASNNDPTIGEALQKAFELRQQDSVPGVEVAAPQKAFLVKSLSDEPELKIKPVRCIEEVSFSFLHFAFSPSDQPLLRSAGSQLKS